MSIEMAWPWRRGVSGTSSCSGDQLSCYQQTNERTNWRVKVVMMGERDSRMTICNDPIQSDLMQVRRLQLQHLVDPLPVDLIRRLDQLLRTPIRSAKALLNQLLAVLVQQVKGVEMRTRRDLDQLREAVADLSRGQGSQEREVEEGVDRGVVGA